MKFLRAALWAVFSCALIVGAEAGVYDYSTTAGSNISVGGISIAEGMARASVNNAIRAELADVAKFLADQSCSVSTAGSANAYTFDLNSNPTAYADNMVWCATASFSVTGAATGNVESIGVKDIKKIVAGVATALASGDYPSGAFGVFTYSSSANAIILLNPYLTVTAATSAIAALTPAADKFPYFTSASAAALADLSSAMRTFLTTSSSANLRGVTTDETGTGLAVFNDTPTLIAPLLGTPTSGNAANLTNLPVSGISGFGTGIATWLATPSSANLAAAITDETGSGKAVFDTTPTLVTPVLGVATATSVNKVTITAPASSATLTIPNGVVLTGPASSGTAMTLGNAETVTGAKTFGSAGAVGKLIVAGTTSGTTILDATATASGTLTFPAATDTLVGKATADALTNKTYTSNTAVISLADDTATTITFTLSTFAEGVLIIGSSDEVPGGGIFRFRVGTSPATQNIGNTATSNTTITTGALTGTTGTDTNVTISAHTDNKLYIENRRGSTKTFNVAILALTPGASIASIP